MSDTDPIMVAEYRRRLLAVSPGRRVVMACDMFQAAKALVAASIRMAGVSSEGELRRQLFLRFYGRDFDESERAKILEYLDPSGS